MSSLAALEKQDILREILSHLDRKDQAKCALLSRKLLPGVLGVLCREMKLENAEMLSVDTVSRVTRTLSTMSRLVLTSRRLGSLTAKR